MISHKIMIPDNKQSEDSVKTASPSGHSTLPQIHLQMRFPRFRTNMYVNQIIMDQLNIRESPIATISGKLTHGDSIQVISIQDGWAKVEFNQDVGYIKADYLVDEEPSQCCLHMKVFLLMNYINVYKSRRVLELWNGDELIGNTISLSFNPIGHKEKEGDGKP